MLSILASSGASSAAGMGGMILWLVILFAFMYFFMIRPQKKETQKKNAMLSELATKGTYAKMARGEMVRFMAEREIENPEEIRKFDRLGYTFRRDLSSESEYVFERK